MKWPSGPNLSRARISTEPVTGEVVEWKGDPAENLKDGLWVPAVGLWTGLQRVLGTRKSLRVSVSLSGKYGWIQPTVPVEHPMSDKHQAWNGVLGARKG